ARGPRAGQSEGRGPADRCERRRGPRCCSKCRLPGRASGGGGTDPSDCRGDRARGHAVPAGGRAEPPRRGRGGTLMKLVLIHAMPLDERMWAPQLEALGDAGIETPNLYDLDGASVDEWAAKLLDRYEGELAVVGASIGGYVALGSVCAAPGRDRRNMLRRL